MLQRCLIAAICAFSGLNTNARLCQDVNVRNDVSSYEENLRGCTVIAGNLEIALVEYATMDDYAGVSFPELTEIRGYFLMYRVYGLTTLGYLFPNLSIIRGLSLFKNYSVVLFDLKDLEEIGLYSLKYITRGSTRIEMCPHLCFVLTVDWTKIGNPSHELHYFNSNSYEYLCKTCPDECHGLCWNEYYCQQTAPNNCHPECIGCKEPTTVDHCIKCRSYMDNQTCVKECPKGKVRHPMLVSCMSEEECYNNTLQETWWVYKGECVKECPPQHAKVQNEQQIDCEYCGSDCPVICSGIEIDSKTSSDELNGCTHVNGSLSIKVDSKSKVDELYRNLGTIKEIDGYLKVYRSNSLTSLEFFKELRVVRGEDLESGYAFLLYKNLNLRNLWKWEDNFTFEIRAGDIFFHDNPQLCLSEIETFSKAAKVNYSEYDVSPISNGDKRECDYIKLNVSIVEVNSTNITLMWEDFVVTTNESQLIGYLLSYTQDPFGNITKYEENEEYDESNWETVYVLNSTQQMIVNLNPYTQYAYYVKAYTTTTLDGGQTEIEHFTTLSDDPSELLHFETVSTTSNSVTLSWQHPDFPNGILGRYEMVVYFEADSEKFLAQRNFCRHPQQVHQDNATEAPNTTLDTSVSALCCEKENYNSMKKFDFTCDRLEVITMSHPKLGGCKNYMYSVDGHVGYNHNTTSFPVGIPSRTHKRFKRSYFPTNSSSIMEKTIGDPTLTTYVVKPLKHFSMFIFLLKVCHNETETQCSSPVMAFQRTLPKEDADDIPPELSVHVEGFEAVVKWPEPQEPNAFILSYQVEYKKTDQGEILTKCITREDFIAAGHEYQIKNLLPGQFAVRVKATSLAGSGKFSEFVKFEVTIPARGPSAAFIVGITVTLVLILAGLFYYYRRYCKKLHSLDHQNLISDENFDCSTPAYVQDEWEIPREDVEIFRKIAQGAFVTVYHGLVKSQNQPCAVRMMKSSNMHEKIVFLNEASTLKWFSGAEHVVKLLGVVSKGQQPLVLTELMAKGDLKSFLKQVKSSSSTITAAEMLRMAAEVADGMMYLSSKKFVHRDLAARNCMVSNDCRVKIGDLGLSKELYEGDYYRRETGRLIPLRWMSPESLVDWLFTTDSDVWSYGVLLWEIASYAELPYQEFTNEQVLQFVIARGTLEKPPECPDLLYEIMASCWKWRPSQRLLFGDIVEKLEPYVGQHFRMVSFYHSAEGQEHKMSARGRVYNTPALAAPFTKNTAVYWNVLDDEVSI